MAKRGRPKLSADVACVCLTCGKGYSVPEWRPDGRKYCSRKCWGESKVGKPAPNRVEPRERQCPACGRAFFVGGSGRPPRTQRFCSNRCRQDGITKARRLTDCEAAWLAGLTDGEGNLFHVSRSSWRLSISNTNFELLSRIHQVTGCGNVLRKPSKNPLHADGGNWICYGQRTKDLLLQMLPWLIVKKEKAMTALNTDFDN